MSRLAPFLGILPALLIGLFLLSFPNNTHTTQPLFSTSTPSLSVLANNTISPNTNLPDITSSTTPESKDVSMGATITTAKPQAKKTKASTEIPIETQPAKPALSSQTTTTKSSLQNALVNILCSTTPSSGLRPISGSGVLIDPKGIILTNSHVAQYYLLGNRGVSCNIRSGSPAEDRYIAAPIYISRAWLEANSSVLTEAAPVGTGEHDFALLAVTGSTNLLPLPAQFPFVPLANALTSDGTANVTVGSYGAQSLDLNQIQLFLFPTIVQSSIKNILTFGVDSIDVISLAGSAVAQEGSSGGGVLGASGSLIGTITTSTVTGQTQTRSVNAITATYIRRDYEAQTGKSLDALLGEPTQNSISEFSSQIPILEALISLPASQN